MKPLHAKEIDLLKPAWLTALLLAAVPVWLLPRGYSNVPENIALAPFVFGVVILCLSIFGREFGSQTFSLLLSQPVERRRIWRVKVGWLSFAVFTVFLTWWVSCSACLSVVSRSFTGSDAFLFGSAAAVVATGGGLLTTVVLQQVTAAFWLTVLAPALIAMLMNQAKTLQVLVVLGLYAIGCYWLARRQFLRAQDVGWTGGEVGLPAWLTTGTSSATRQFRPWAALTRKELRLQQLTFMVMAWLFVLNLGTVAWRWMGSQSMNDTVRAGLEAFSMLWIVVPALASSASVAEERKLGTLGQQLCLPVSPAIQLSLKLFFALGIAALSALLVCAVEALASACGVGHRIFNHKLSEADVTMLFLVFIGSAFIGFYASTLARNVLQSLAVAIATATAIALFCGLASHPEMLPHVWLWRGSLVYYISWPLLIAAFLWLDWRNFRSEAGTDRLWCRNAATLGLVFPGLLLLTCAIYNRSWEFLIPTEARPGITRISGPKPVIMNSEHGSAWAAILPDGKLWAGRASFNPGKLVLSFGEETGFRIGGDWRTPGFIVGSNWTHAVATFRDTIAIRSDGTLWISENLRQPAESAGLAQFGSETNWQDVALHEKIPWAVILLKADGTLWSLGTNSSSGRFRSPGLGSFEPRPLSSESGWTRILAGAGTLYAWKRDGTAWSLYEPDKHERAGENEMGMVIERAPWLDHTKWLSVAGFLQFQVGLREDGTLWAWPGGQILARMRKNGITTPQIRRINPDSDWAGLVGDYQTLAARKTDGSIWRWNLPRSHAPRANPIDGPPTRVGSRNDWVALARAWDGVLSLSADGNIYHWWNRDSEYYAGFYFQPMLAPSRAPELIENIFNAPRSP